MNTRIQCRLQDPDLEAILSKRDTAFPKRRADPRPSTAAWESTTNVGPGRCIEPAPFDETHPMPLPTVDDHFEIVTSTAYWMARQLPFRVQRKPLIRIGSVALARAIRNHDPESAIGLETWCRQEVRRAIRDFITDRYEA